MRTAILIASCLLMQGCSEAPSGQTAARNASTVVRQGLIAAPTPQETHVSIPAGIPPKRSEDMAGPARSCGDGKRYCRHMDDCQDAHYHLEQCGLARLDADRDGVPCESICGRN